VASYLSQWWENDEIIFPQFSIYGPIQPAEAEQSQNAPNATSKQHPADIPMHALYEELVVKYEDLKQQIQQQEQDLEALKHPERALYVGDEEDKEPSGQNEEEK
jgi:hypothetical protein